MSLEICIKYISTPSPPPTPPPPSYPPLNPGTTCHGEIIEYDEFLHVPRGTTDADLLTIVQMVTDYVNISNATLTNVSASFGHTAEWLEQRRVYFGRPTNSPPPAPPPEDKNRDVERPFLFDEDGVRVDIPQVARANGLTAHFTTTTGFRMRYILAEGLAAQYTLAGKARGDPEQMPNAYFHRATCGDEEATLVKVHVRLLLQPWAAGVDARTDFFMRMYGVTLDAALKRFDVRSCFTETTENVRLECDPAPSPPPPDDWQTPPSPPAFAYEVITLASATGGSALFFVISAVCCIGVGGRSIRARHNSRQLGVRWRRVDEMPWKKEGNARFGSEPTAPFGPDDQQPGARLATGFSFSGLNIEYNQVRNL